MEQKKILVVDDEKEIRDLLSIELEQHGYRVTTASSGEECLALLNDAIEQGKIKSATKGEDSDRLKQGSFDLVLLDLRMPGISGSAVLEEIKKIDSDIEVIIITTDAMVDTAIESIKNGAYDYIIKPFNLEDLKNKIYKCLEKKQLYEEEKKQRILIIDDDEATTDTTKYILTQENFNVAVVNEGKMGIEKATNDIPDLIILDIMLPDMSGWDVVETLKKDKMTRDIPVIMVSGIMIRTKDEVRSFNSGVDDFIIKPFDPVALIRRIKSILRKTEEIKILKDEANLYKVARAISSLMEIDELLSLILKSSVEISNSDGGTIMLYDSKTEEFEIKTTYGAFNENIIGRRIKLGERIAGRAAKEKKPIIIHGHLKDDPRFRQLEQYNKIISGMAVPMFLKEKLVGCITLKRTKGEKRFTEHESNLLLSFASQVALSVENAYLYEKVRKKKAKREGVAS